MKPTAVNKFSKLIASAFLLLAPFAVGADDGDWYATGSIVYNDDDPDRRIDDSVSGIQFNFGRDFRRNLAFEGLLSYSDIDGYYLVTPPGTWVRDSETNIDLGANILAFYDRDARFAPYVLAGIGLHRADRNVGGTENSPSASLGAGFKFRLGDSPFSLRTEFRVRRAFESDQDYNDIIGTLGLQYSFGGGADSTRAIPLAAEPAEAPVAPAEPAAPAAPADTDGDGVPDGIDRCANTASGVIVDAKGCEKVRLKNTYFATESAAIDDIAKRKLDATAAALLRNPELKFEIAGHADSRGPDDYNMRLSVKRAEAVRSYLEQKGVSAERMTVRGYGESQPVASNDTVLGRYDNRRVELRVLGR